MSYVKDLFSYDFQRELEQTRQQITAAFQSLINFPTGTGKFTCTKSASKNDQVLNHQG
jgi:hypothetical protein